MKIAWFTPFSKKSAIGKYSQIATNNLANFCEIDLWLFEKDNLLETKLKKCYYKGIDDLGQMLSKYDFIVYNMGDYLYYHLDIYQVSLKHEGVVILHDYVMHHFFEGYFFAYLKDYNAYIDFMEKLYGDKGKVEADMVIQGKRKSIGESSDILDYPCIESFYENAIAIITHSKYLSNIVGKVYQGPIKTIYFPFSDELIEKNTETQVEIPINTEKINILTTGNVNPNKRIHKLIETIGKNQEIKDKVCYHIIGSLSDPNYMDVNNKLIRKYQLENCVNFLGFQEDEILNEYINKCDLMCNLRYPAMEGASWSLLEQLYNGKSTIVTNIGFYSEMPNDCVWKINPQSEEDELKEILLYLIHNKNEILRIGNNAKIFAYKNFNVDKYCTNFTKFGERIIFNKPIITLINKVSSLLIEMNIESGMDIISKVSDEINEITENNIQENTH